MAFTFLCLLLYLYQNKIGFLYAGLIILVLGMTSPKLFNPLSSFWYGLGKVLGEISSRIILFFTYLIFVSPVAILKKTQWKKKFNHYDLKLNPLTDTEQSSPYTKSDIENPY
jgi:hypothetical protein